MESAPYSRRQIEPGPDGSTVESGSGPEGDQVYDAAMNTIYISPPPATQAPRKPHPEAWAEARYLHPAGREGHVISARQARALRKRTVRIAFKVRKQNGGAISGLALILASSIPRDTASSDDPGPSPDPGSPAFRDQILALLNSGSARVDGHRTIDGRDTIEISSADGHTTYYVDPDSYDPVELDTTGTGGGVALRFHTYEGLPAEGNGGLLDLRAEHPNATVDRNASHYQAAQARLFPHG